MTTKATATKTRKQRSPKKRRNTSKRKKGFPWWGIVVGAVLVVVVYVVVLRIFLVTPLSFRWKAMFGDPDYPEGYEVRGIDVSHYQEDINWEVLRNSKINERPLQFVIVKATEGVTLLDENFNDNFYKAHENDLVRGAYHFYIPSKDANAQAKNYLKQVHLVPGDLPPILDVEKRGTKKLSDFQKDVKTWLDIVEQKYGVTPIIYANLDFKRNYLNDPRFDKYPFWVANYYHKDLKYNGEWVIWQYTDCGKIDGMKGEVDFNIFNGSLQELRNFLIPEPTDTNP